MIRSTVQLKRYLEALAGFHVVRERKLHYSSDWHSYNLKRKVAGAPGVTEELFEARQSAPAESAVKVTGVPRLVNSIASLGATVEADSDEELADAEEEEASDSLSKLNVNESGAGGEDDADMHKHHGFFVPNVDYLKDPEGFSLTSVLRSRETSCVSTAASCAMHSSA
ncbi:hypothetical protein DY000_02002613 [Brassica cretica]|uniref:Uncharacterized protein n=1 Tax=Brassica cretica TaxID=69181 RepID=A0ABQ7C0G0_BRACR|nr:hypothetical protein DY000_02002613 [Brassica cretica]